MPDEDTIFGKIAEDYIDSYDTAMGLFYAKTRRKTTPFADFYNQQFNVPETISDIKWPEQEVIPVSGKVTEELGISQFTPERLARLKKSREEQQMMDWDAALHSPVGLDKDVYESIPEDIRYKLLRWYENPSEVQLSDEPSTEVVEGKTYTIPAKPEGESEFRIKARDLAEGLGPYEAFEKRLVEFVNRPISKNYPLSIGDTAGIVGIVAAGAQGAKLLWDKLAGRLLRTSLNQYEQAQQKVDKFFEIPKETKDAFVFWGENTIPKTKIYTEGVKSLLNPSRFNVTAQNIQNVVKDISQTTDVVAKDFVGQLTKFTATATGVPSQTIPIADIISNLTNKLPNTVQAVQAARGELGAEIPQTEEGITLAGKDIDVELEPLLDTPIGTMSKDIIKGFGIRSIIDRFNSLKKQKNLPLEYKTKFDEITKAYDLNFRTQKTLDRRQELLAHLNKIKAEGEEIDIPEGYIEMAGKVNISDLTPRELESLYNEANFVVQQAKLKNRLLKVRTNRRVDRAVDEITEQLGKVEPSKEVITSEALKRGLWGGVKERAQGFLARTYRQERVFRELDNYESGPLTRMIYEPINEAKTEFLSERIGVIEGFKKVIKDNKIDFAKMVSSKEKFGEVTLTPEEKIGVYLSSLNPDNLLHLKLGNNFTDELIKEVIDSLTPEEKILAEYIRTYFNDPVRQSELSKVRQQIEGKPLTPVKEYFPIKLEWRADPELDASNLIAKEEIYRYAAKWASSGISKGFTKERTHKAIQPVTLKAFEIFENNLALTSHYKAFAPVIRDIQLIINKPSFRSAYKNRVGDAGYSVLNRWLKQVAQADPLRVTSAGERLGRFFRTNAVTAVLGFNITTAMKQFPSFFSGMAEAGVTPVMRGFATFLSNPKATLNLIKEKSPQIHARTMERELAEVKVGRNIAKRITGKITPRDVFMILTTTMDRVAVSSIWRGAYDDYLRKNPTKESEAARYADKVIRDTQPFFDVKDIPEYWRSGELTKALTMFTNQLNNYWNYYRFDTFGARFKGKISTFEMLKRLLFTFVVPSILIGMITRSQLPKDAEDIADDMTGMGVATIPVYGSWISAGLRGY
ncbi:MAG: hypothetical protein H3Z50_08170, partial [archaeon]|nr:hypothetical protein [archaeon]